MGQCQSLQASLFPSFLVTGIAFLQSGPPSCFFPFLGLTPCPFECRFVDGVSLTFSFFLCGCCG